MINWEKIDKEKDRNRKNEETYKTKEYIDEKYRNKTENIMEIVETKKKIMEIKNELNTVRKSIEMKKIVNSIDKIKNDIRKTRKNIEIKKIKNNLENLKYEIELAKKDEKEKYNFFIEKEQIRKYQDNNINKKKNPKGMENCKEKKWKKRKESGKKFEVKSNKYKWVNPGQIH